jgi:hypothetical protein
MIKKEVILPAEGDREKFCEFMGYQLVKKIEDTPYYRIPSGHVCRFLINLERWKEGSFDKENFLKSLK